MTRQQRAVLEQLEAGGELCVRPKRDRRYGCSYRLVTAAGETRLARKTFEALTESGRLRRVAAFRGSEVWTR